VDFCQEVERETGVKPLIYTAPLWWRGQMKRTDLPPELSGYRFWIADLGDRSLQYEKPRLPPGAVLALWQFTWTAKLDEGFGDVLDASVFKGNPADLKKALGTPIHAVFSWPRVDRVIA
jgi:GH25 family lysozyme M1 (1,4-beta-N-acetylmuramidase)